MNLAMVLAVASAAAIAGDLTGYAIGRKLGHAAIRRLNPKIKEKVDEAEKHVRKWGSWSIFLTRWLITPLGPTVNLISGASEFPFLKFLCWDVVGEVLWVVLYVMIGRLIEAEVQAISAVAYDIIWVLVCLAIAGVLAWRIVLIRKRAVWDTIVLDAD